jgi:predicted GNAT family N-acyltransferase
MLVIARTDDLAACFAIRRAVFMDEQGVPEALEFDGEDEACAQWLAVDEAGPVGTMRVRPAREAAKRQRVAVLARARGTGVGDRLMRHVLRELAAEGIARASLDAQVPVIPFYERLGFAAHGPEFDDAGIPHRAMSLDLSTSRFAPG